MLQDMRQFSAHDGLETVTYAAHYLIQILAACGEAVIELHIHESAGGFNAESKVFPLINDAGLKAYVEFLDLRLAIERTLRVGINIIGVIARAERKHGAKAKHDMILGVVAGNEGDFDEFKRVVVATLPLMEGAFDISTHGDARLHRELLGKPIGQAIAKLERKACVVAHQRAVLKLPCRDVYTVFPLSLLCRCYSDEAHEQQQCDDGSFHDIVCWMLCLMRTKVAVLYYMK